jgi:hypothetical protein
MARMIGSFRRWLLRPSAESLAGGIAPAKGEFKITRNEQPGDYAKKRE